MFDVLVYLYETYYRPDACPDSEALVKKLSAVGFEEEEISKALGWLTDLAETAGTPDVIEHAAGLSARHVVLFAVTRETEMTTVAAAAPATEADMFRMVAVQEMLDRREALLKGLRQRGVLVVEMAPAAPAALLIDQYLSVKDRNLI